MAPRKADNCIVRCAGNERAMQAGRSGYWRVECLDGCVFTSESSMESDVLISVSNVRQRVNVEVNCLGGCFVVDIGRQQRLAHEATSKRNQELASTERFTDRHPLRRLPTNAT
jgi:hypothetical protein